MDINIDDLPTVIYSCFVLHNFCGMNKESVSEELVRTVMEEEESQPGNQLQRPTQSNEVEGKRARRVITKYLDNLRF